MSTEAVVRKLSDGWTAVSCGSSWVDVSPQGHIHLPSQLAPAQVHDFSVALVAATELATGTPAGSRC